MRPDERFHEGVGLWTGEEVECCGWEFEHCLLRRINEWCSVKESGKS